LTEANPHLKPILIAGLLAAAAVALGMLTLSRQAADSSGDAAPAPLVTHVTHATPKAKPVPVAAKPVAKPKPRVNPSFRAARAAGLPKAVAEQFAARPVVVVTLFSSESDVDELAQGEAKAGAELAAAGYAGVDVAKEGASGAITKVFGVLPLPTTLVLVRPSYTQPYVRLDGFADRETVAQAARNATPLPAAATQTAWARAANALCRKTAAKFTALPVADSAASLKQKTPQVEALSTAFVADLRQLKPPAGRAADVTRFVSLAERDLDLTVAMARATARKDLVALATAAAEESTVGKQANALAIDLGATACAAPF